MPLAWGRRFRREFDFTSSRTMLSRACRPNGARGGDAARLDGGVDECNWAESKTKIREHAIAEARADVIFRSPYKMMSVQHRPAPRGPVDFRPRLKAYHWLIGLGLALAVGV